MQKYQTIYLIAVGILLVYIATKQFLWGSDGTGSKHPLAASDLKPPSSVSDISQSLQEGSQEVDRGGGQSEDVKTPSGGSKKSVEVDRAGSQSEYLDDDEADDEDDLRYVRTLSVAKGGPKKSVQVDLARSQSEYVKTLSGVLMPRLIYGTAWKKEQTEEMVFRALNAGFQGIDTACQPKHYNEPGVGVALRTAHDAGIKRESLFIQTKVNPQYAAQLAPKESITKQVELSIATSLENLGVKYVDSLVLHTPYNKFEKTIEAWKAMEKAFHANLTRQLGISNVRHLQQLRRVYEKVEVKPAVVQQSFHSKNAFEKDMRAWCVGKGIYFQSFWTLTANSKQGQPGKGLVVSTNMFVMAKKYGVTPQVLFFRFLMGENIVVLSGTKSDIHMKQDLAARHVQLEPRDAEKIRVWLDLEAQAGSYKSGRWDHGT